LFRRYVHDPFGRVLQRSRPSVVAQLYVKVQSDRRRGPTEAVATGMFERVTVGRRAQKVKPSGPIVFVVSQISGGAVNIIRFVTNSKKKYVTEPFTTTVRAYTWARACVFGRKVKTTGALSHELAAARIA